MIQFIHFSFSGSVKSSVDSVLCQKSVDAYVSERSIWDRLSKTSKKTQALVAKQSNEKSVQLGS